MNELKRDVCCRLFGPRRKMMTAIALWNGARCHQQNDRSLSQPDSAVTYQVTPVNDAVLLANTVHNV